MMKDEMIKIIEKIFGDLNILSNINLNNHNGNDLFLSLRLNCNKEFYIYIIVNSQNITLEFITEFYGKQRKKYKSNEIGLKNVEKELNRIKVECLMSRI